MEFDLNSAREVVEKGMGEAGELIKDPSRIGDLLSQLQEKLKTIPVAGEILSDIPLTISMVKSYVTREYAEVSPKVIITLVSAFIYIVKKNDIIPDSIPVVGQIDDIGVLAFAIKFVEPELRAYQAWKDARQPQ